MKSYELPHGLWSLGLSFLGQKRQDYVSGILHSGAVPEVQGSGRRERSLVYNDILTLTVPHG